MSRHLLLVLLMLMLPLQWSWAAAASVCAHEVDAQVSHFGHHAHEHEAAPAADADEKQEQGFSVHADCGVCQGLGTAYFAEADHAPHVWSGASRFTPYDSAVPDRTVETLLRPPLTLVS